MKHWIKPNTYSKRSGSYSVAKAVCGASLESIILKPNMKTLGVGTECRRCKRILSINKDKG